ncbi:MAG: hypothetical protein ACI33O_12455 [Bhargavaea sp.]
MNVESARRRQAVRLSKEKAGDPADVEDALVSPLKMNFVNQAVHLYSGEFSLEDGIEIFQLNGQVTLKWYPESKIEWAGTITGLGISVEKAEKFLQESVFRTYRIMTPTGFRGEAFISRFDMESGELAGSISGAFSQPLRPAERLQFSVVNFYGTAGEPIRHLNLVYRGRMRVRHGAYRILFDQVHNYDETYRSLDELGGYGVTHAGLIERTDGQPADPKTVNELIDALNWVLSFNAGRSVGICSIHGSDAQGNMFKQYRVPAVDSWKNQANWCPGVGNDPEDKLGRLVENVMGKFTIPHWQQTLPRLLHWYLSAKSAGFAENRLVSVHAALVKLAWKVLVEEEKVLSAQEFERFPVDMQIRRLLQFCAIPAAIPRHTIRVGGYADGPQLIAAYYKETIHANRRNLQALSDRDKEAILQLGVQYLELALLHLLGYTGRYNNLLLGGERPGRLEPVPWIKSL